jgi:hypothetical protein
VPFAVPRSFDVLQEGLLDEVFFEDCWPTALPPSQGPPGPRDLTLLDGLLAEDVAVAALDAAARAAVRRATLGIERRVPFLTSSGQTLPAPHRLLLALEMAKVFRAMPGGELTRLVSVVVYPGVTKLRRGHDELGALLMRGPFRLLPTLGSLHDRTRLLLELAGLGGAAVKPWRRELRQLVGDCAVWQDRIAPGRALVDDVDAFVAFTQRGRGVVARGAAEVRRHGALQQALTTADIDLAGFIERRLDECERLASASEALTIDAGASIHLPWSTQLACHATTGHDPLIHELAHLVDFARGGIDGLPSSSLAPRWRAAWDELAPRGAVLHASAYANPAEFFAVATEAFFTDSEGMAREASTLTQLLQDTWGQRPPPRPRRSSWWVGRRLLFSPFGGHFD